MCFSGSNSDSHVIVKLKRVGGTLLGVGLCGKHGQEQEFACIAFNLWLTKWQMEFDLFAHVERLGVRLGCCNKWFDCFYSRLAGLSPPTK